MSTPGRQQLEEAISALKQQRDEIQLRLHLAEMEARQEYDRLSGRIDELSSQYEPVREAAAESAENVIAALRLAADEMKAGLARIRKVLSD
jgi:chromosome segregation ATPase